MSYFYVATTKKGRLKRGSSDLGSRASVIAWLEVSGLVPISVEEEKQIQAVQSLISLFFGSVSHTERLLFTKHLSIMLRAGLSLLESLHILEEQASSWRFRRLLSDFAKTVEQGGKLSDALLLYPRIFSAFYVNIVRAGEISGNLERNLIHLADQMAKDREVQQKVRTALLYPGIVLITALGIGFFFAVAVLPQVASLFGALKGIKLPLVTTVMLSFANLIRHHTLSSILTIVFVVAGTLWAVRLKVLAPITHRILLKMPVVGKIVRDVNLARFALVMGTSLKSGIDITKSAEITSSVLGNIYYRRVLEKMLEEIQKGVPMSEVLLSESKLFPRLVARMIEVGEKTGRLEEVLSYLADFYELEVETTMKNLSTVLEPLLLMFIGLVTLALAFAIIIPIYDYISAISRI